MFDSSQQNFYTRWMDRSKKESDQGNDYFAFDEFISLYIVYNFLYREVFQKLHQKKPEKYVLRGGKGKKYIPDRLMATEWIWDYIDPDEFYQISLRDSDNLTKLRSLVNRLSFNIHLDPATGNPLQEEDKKLANDLIKDGSPDEVSKAVIIMIYAVRCNLFHGSKNLSSVQDNLLKPLSSILRELVEKVYEQLNSSEKTGL